MPSHRSAFRRTQSADAHLAYIRAVPGVGEEARYDVYPAAGGDQLGVVYKLGPRAWEASDGTYVSERSTRWEAATALWGDA